MLLGMNLGCLAADTFFATGSALEGGESCSTSLVSRFFSPGEGPM